MKIEDPSKNQKVPLHEKGSKEAKEQQAQALDEDQILQSIDNLDMLLANV